MTTGGTGLVGLALLPLGAALLWHVWEAARPFLIAARTIDALAEDLIARHGPQAEAAAFIEEDRAWREAETAAQGQWRRVRRAIRRRHAVGA